MYLGFWRPVALKPAPLLGVGRKCALELSNSGEGPEHFVTRVKLASVRGDLDLETDARWLAASCGSAGAAAKPAR